MFQYVLWHNFFKYFVYFYLWNVWKHSSKFAKLEITSLQYARFDKIFILLCSFFAKRSLIYQVYVWVEFKMHFIISTSAYYFSYLYKNNILINDVTLFNNIKIAYKLNIIKNILSSIFESGMCRIKYLVYFVFFLRIIVADNPILPHK